MRFLVLLCTLSAWAQDFSYQPGTVKQGETLIVHGTKDAVKARMNKITIPLFSQEDGVTGLMPVGVEDEPGEYKLEFLDQAGTAIHEMQIEVHDAHYPKQNIVIAPE